MSHHHHHHGHAAPCGDGHDTAHTGEGVSDGRRLAVAFVIIAAFMVLEIAGGLISGSLALLADAGHMATDAGALLLALSARWLATRKMRSDVVPFGLRRAQVLAGFVNAVALLVLTGWLVVEAINRFFDPQPIISGFMLAVAIAGLVANLGAFAILHGGSSHDLNMRGALVHVIGDIFGSVAAIISAVVIAMTDWVRIDPILTLIVSALILRVAWPLLSQAAHILLQGAPANLDTGKIGKALTDGVPGVTGVHQLKAWMLTPEEIQLAMHLHVSDSSKAPDVLQRVKAILHDDFGISHSTIQIECEDCPDDVILQGQGEGQSTQRPSAHRHDHGAKPAVPQEHEETGDASGSAIRTASPAE